MLTQLKDIGLSDNEAKVYLAMLELGPATVLQIASKAGINRPTTYVQIEALKKRGLVDTFMKGKKTLYSPQEPTRLEAMLERESKAIEVHKVELAKIVPQLQTMWDLGGKKPRVRYFEGVEGLRQMQDEFLKCKDKQILALSSLDNVIEVFPKQLESYAPRRISKGIKSRLIYTAKNGAVLPRSDSDALQDTRFIKADTLPFTSDITIYDDSVAIASLAIPFSGTIITHADIATSFKSLFELIWHMSDVMVKASK